MSPQRDLPETKSSHDPLEFDVNLNRYLHEFRSRFASSLHLRRSNQHSFPVHEAIGCEMRSICSAQPSF